MVEIGYKEIEDVRKRLGEFKDKAETLMARALNRAAAKTKTEIGREVPRKYTVKKKDVMTTLNDEKASKGKLNALVYSKTDGAIPLDRFQFTPKKPNHKKPKQAQVTVKKGVKKYISEDSTFRKGFTHAINDSSVLFRGVKGTRRVKGVWDRLPIHKLYGSPVPEMLNQPEFGEYVDRVATETYEKRLEHEINQALMGNTFTRKGK